eukprot:CAMPEP_0117683802 /NCGR_PEP_ID=MMETSP0804-20121206/20651_1 /TAXON_ID=1074897 /ORGANISM="Tetraselmis astigmatica, Strain CCMP880" /LENGTH=167 /DNA_ID=CAMNT_0005494533 /DNA_START=213 /DNA_END=716 /DNA_ORIENTATION=+
MIHKNYAKSGSMDTEDTSDIYDFLRREHMVVYIYLAAMRMDKRGNNYINIICKTLDSVIDVEETAGGEDGQDGGDMGKLYAEEEEDSPWEIGGDSERLGREPKHNGILEDKVARAHDTFSAFITPLVVADPLALKRMVPQVDTRNNTKDRYAALLTNPECPPEIKRE